MMIWFSGRGLRLKTRWVVVECSVMEARNKGKLNCDEKASKQGESKRFW